MLAIALWAQLNSSDAEICNHHLSLNAVHKKNFNSFM